MLQQYASRRNNGLSKGSAGVILRYTRNADPQDQIEITGTFMPVPTSTFIWRYRVHAGGYLFSPCGRGYMRGGRGLGRLQGTSFPS